MPLANAYKPDIEKTEYKIAPVGRPIAMCYQVINFGTLDTKYGPKDKLIFGFELHGEGYYLEDGRPMSITTKRYNATLGKNRSGVVSEVRGVIGGWRGKSVGDDEIKKDPIGVFRSCLGLPAELVIAHSQGEKIGDDGKPIVYANISQIMLPRPNDTIPKMVNDPIFFDAGNWDDEVFQKLPVWIKKIVEQSQEFQERASFISPQQSTMDLTPKPRPSNRVHVDVPEDFDDTIPF